MKRGVITAGLVALILVAGGVAFVRLHRANETLRTQLLTARAEAVAIDRQRDENEKLRGFVEGVRGDAVAARREMDASLDQARREVAALEQQASRRYETRVEKDRAAAEALARNRDLAKGPVLVEHCTNAGRATPVQALETLVWAGLKGDDSTIQQLLGIDDSGRARLAAAIASLPEGARATYPTPDRLAGLYVADAVTSAAALHVLKQTPLDGRHMLLEVGRLSGKTIDIPMVLGPDGWQVAIDGNAAKKIVGRLLGGTKG